MHVIGRVKLEDPIIMAEGDLLRLAYISIDGVVRFERNTTFAILRPGRPVTVTEAVLFEREFEGRYAIGAMLLEDGAGSNVVQMKAMGEDQ